jgi:anti-sigma regulatory factor (Ser/Thr protein kinase)
MTRTGRWQDLLEQIVLTDARAAIPPVLDRLEAHGRAAGFAEEALLDLRLVAEEILTNIAKYAFLTADEAAVELRFSVAGATARLEFRDAGRAFDPLAEPPPDLEAPIENRAVGGLGLPLVRALVDEARYRREGASNVLELVRHGCLS